MRIIGRIKMFNISELDSLLKDNNYYLSGEYLCSKKDLSKSVIDGIIEKLSKHEEEPKPEEKEVIVDKGKIVCRFFDVVNKGLLQKLLEGGSVSIFGKYVILNNEVSDKEFTNLQKSLTTNTVETINTQETPTINDTETMNTQESPKHKEPVEEVKKKSKKKQK